MVQALTAWSLNYLDISEPLELSTYMLVSLACQSVSLAADWCWWIVECGCIRFVCGKILFSR